MKVPKYVRRVNTIAMGFLLICNRSSTSEIFTFYVGPEKHEFQVEVGLIAQISKPLSALMKGSMKEGLEKKAELPEVEVQVFKDFLQFVRTGQCPSEVLSIIHQSHGPFSLLTQDEQDDHEANIHMLKHFQSGQDIFYCFTCGMKTSLWYLDCGRDGCKDIAVAMGEQQSLDYPRPFCAYRGWYTYEGSVAYSCKYCEESLETSPDAPPLHTATQLDCPRCLEITIDMPISYRNCEKRNADLPVELLLNVVYHHCKMYVFADTYCIESLQQTILCLVWAELAVVDVKLRFRHSDFSLLVRILEYVVANTKSSVGSDHTTAKPDRLCETLTNLFVHRKKDLSSVKEYSELIERNLDVTRELFLAALRMSLDRW